MTAGVSIGEAAIESGVKVPTIRYYEQIGLLPAASRSAANRRLFGRSDLDRLKFIRHARELGFDVEAIRALVSLQDDPSQPCGTADRIAKERLAAVEQRISSLVALRAELQSMIDGCSHGRVTECKVIEVLADHAKCQTEH